MVASSDRICRNDNMSPNDPGTEFWRRDVRLAEIEKTLPQIRLLSLDIFDTLLFRTCQAPQDVFLETGRRAKEQGVLCRSLSAEEFRAAREYAMDAAYRASSQEPFLEGIVDLLPTGFGDHVRLIQLETQAEADYCYLNPSILSLIRHCRARNIRIALVSDMYLGRRRILDLLQRVGFTLEATDQLLVSVDEKARKAGGLLFRRLLAMNTDVGPGEILHIGDNVASDVEAARREGIRSIHYDIVNADTGGAFAYEATRHGPVLPELHALRRLAAASGARFKPEDQAWIRVAATCLGPFLAALCDWVVDTACNEGAEIIAPFMREAVTLAPMLERTIRERGLCIPVVPLFVSREAVVLAGLERVDAQVVRSFFENRAFFQVGNLFQSLELGGLPDRFAAHREVFLGQAWSVQLGAGRTLLEELTDFLLTSGTRATIEATIRRRRTALVGYLDGVFGETKRAVTVDLGFLGQIQRGIDSALRQEGRSLRLKHLLGFAKGNSGELLVRGVDLRAFVGGGGAHRDLIDTIHRSAPVLEQLLMGRDGSTVGYEAVGNTFRPVREANPLEEGELARKELVRLALGEFQDLWFYFRRAKPEIVARVLDDKRGWCQMIHRLIDMPTAEEAGVIGSLHDDCNFGSAQVVPICPAEEEQRIRRIGAHDYHRFLRHRSPAVWPQGCVTRVDPGAILSHFAVSVDTGYFERMLEFSRRIAGEGVREIVVYGAGEVGRNLIRAARLSGLKVLCAVDRNTALWGTHLDGVEITSLGDAAAKGVPDYAIASFFFADEIRRAINAQHRGQSPGPRVFHPDDPYQEQPQSP
jgi:FMN phosphatase YigB (HAD superfamily)